MGNDRVDVETSVAGLIEQLDDDAIDRLLGHIDHLESILMIVMTDDGEIHIEALTTVPDGKEALAAASNMYGGMAVECHRRFATCVTALREQFGEEIEAVAPDAPGSAA